MKCPHCGREHPDDFLFCPSTGKKIEILKACANPQCPNLGKHILPVVALFCPVCGKQLENDASPAGKDNSCLRFTVGGVSFKMIRVEAGTFRMGSGMHFDEPVHEVTLTQNYYIGETLVTQELWQAVMDENPSYYKGNRFPVESVSWFDCQAFIKQLSNKMSRTFRLPTEAEWEFSACGGRNSKGYEYAGGSHVDEVAWYDKNTNRRTHLVADKKSNELGLYDMSGNVWEWCNDCYNRNYYANSPSKDPQGPQYDSFRVVRGGSYSNNSRYCRVSFRFSYMPSYRSRNLGLRLAL